jgi:Pyridoxal-dependent decarboxylase conserved domain
VSVTPQQAVDAAHEVFGPPDAEDALSLSEYGPALGRRFRALKLWVVLRCHGASGLREHVRRGVALAATFERWAAEAPGWELCAPRPLSASSASSTQRRMKPPSAKSVAAAMQRAPASAVSEAALPSQPVASSTAAAVAARAAPRRHARRTPMRSSAMPVLLAAPRRRRDGSRALARWYFTRGTNRVRTRLKRSGLGPTFALAPAPLMAAVARSGPQPGRARLGRSRSHAHPQSTKQ